MLHYFSSQFKFLSLSKLMVLSCKLFRLLHWTRYKLDHLVSNMFWFLIVIGRLFICYVVLVLCFSQVRMIKFSSSEQNRNSKFSQNFLFSFQKLKLHNQTKDCIFWLMNGHLICWSKCAFWGFFPVFTLFSSFEANKGKMRQKWGKNTCKAACHTPFYITS